MAFVRADLADSHVVVPGVPFDAVTLGFGVRYLRDPAATVRGLARMTVAGGRLVLLDFCVPERGPILDRAAAGYFFRALPRIAGMLSGDRSFYDMLVDTTVALGGPERLPALAAEAGLNVIEVRRMGFGIVVGVVAEKP